MGQPGVVSLIKGQNMSLSKVAPNLRHARIGLGWDVRQTPGAPFDLDTSVFLLNSTGKVSKPQDFIFYNNKQSMDGSVMHHGDNLTGAGEGDDEQVSIDLTRLSPDIQRVVVVCSIYEAEQRQQNFGMVQRAFIRVVDQDVNQEIVRYDLTEEACMSSTMVFGELYRYGQEWKFKALGNPMQGGLRQLGTEFGIQLA
jgi:tellurium resistance protein TerD